MSLVIAILVLIMIGAAVIVVSVARAERRRPATWTLRDVEEGRVESFPNHVRFTPPED